SASRAGTGGRTEAPPGARPRGREERGAVSTKPRDEFIEANGLRFHYREWGDPRTRHAIVMLHGYAETLETWTEAAQDLSREFRVIAIDQRGHGGSDRAPDQ